MAGTRPDPLWKRARDFAARLAEVSYVLTVAAAHLIWLPIAEAIADRIRRRA